MQSKSATGSSTAPSAVFTSTPTQGNLLVASVQSGENTAITMSSGGWSALTSAAGGSGGSTRAGRMFYKLAGAGESTTVTATSANGAWAIALAEYSGVNKINTLNVENSQLNASSASQTTPTVSPIGSGDLLIVAAVGSRGTDGTFSSAAINASTTGVTQRENPHASNSKISLMDKFITATSGTYNASATDSGGAFVGAGEIAAFNVGGIDLDATSTSGAQSGADPWDWSHTCAGSDRLLVVAVSSSSRHPTGITYNSVALTQQQTAINGSAYASIWYLKNPSTGTNTISVDFLTTTLGDAGAISFTGADQTTQPDASATENGTSATTNVLNLTTVANNTVIIDAISLDSALSNDDLNAAATQTELYNVNGIGGGLVDTGGSYKGIGTAAASTMTWTWTVVASTTSYAHVGMSVNPVTAAGATPVRHNTTLLGA